MQASSCSVIQPLSVVGDLVLHDVHEAGVEGNSLANELEVAESDDGEVANLETEAVAKFIAAESVRDAEGVAGLVDFAAEGEGAVGGEKVVRDGLRLGEVAVVDVLEDKETRLVVDAAEDDGVLDARLAALAGARVFLDELLAGDEGEVGELGSVVDGAQEDLVAGTGVVEDVHAAGVCGNV